MLISVCVFRLLLWAGAVVAAVRVDCDNRDQAPFADLTEQHRDNKYSHI